VVGELLGARVCPDTVGDNVGCTVVGSAVVGPAVVGLPVGDFEGKLLGNVVGSLVGGSVVIGLFVGDDVGPTVVGFAVVGSAVVGLFVGDFEGKLVGSLVGDLVGDSVVVPRVGAPVGVVVTEVGLFDGDEVGSTVGPTGLHSKVATPLLSFCSPHELTVKVCPVLVVMPPVSSNHNGVPKSS